MTCTEPDCTNVLYARGWCTKHWSYHKHRNSPQWRATTPAQPPIHGTRKRYEKGCRCDDCCRRESEYRARWRLATGRTDSSRVLDD